MRKLFAVALVLAATPGSSFTQPFSFEYLRSDLVPTIYGSVSWADADLDGKMDVVLTGSTQPEEPFQPAATLYLQRERTGSAETRYQYFEAVPLPLSVWHSASAWHDFDRDGDPDLLLMGATNAEQPYEGRTALLRNDGTGTLVEIPVALPGLYAGSVDWGDYDNDGDSDLLLTGLSGDDFVTALLRNDNGSFSLVDAGLADVGYGCARFGDYDGDLDLDIGVTGQSADGYVTEIYRNDGGTFVGLELDQAYGLVYSSAAWGDADNDGDLDLLVSGGQLSENLYSGLTYVLYNEASTFQGVQIDNEGLLGGAVVWGDVNQDGALDAVVTGSYFPAGPRASRVYFNEDTGLEYRANLPGAVLGDAQLADYDADGDSDIVLTGVGAEGALISNLYENSALVVNDPPSPPSGTSASVDGRRVTFSWDAAVDDRSQALTYSVRVGTAAGTVDVLSPGADVGSGYRYFGGPGNVSYNRGWVIDDLPPGTYWWSVQAVDGSFQGSSFSAPQSFTITP